MDIASYETPGRGFSARAISIVRHAALLATCACAVLRTPAANATNAPAAAPFNFASPKLLTGTLYALGSHRQKILFTFRRTAIRSGHTVRVTRRFFSTNGAIVAQEDLVYDAGRLASLQMCEHQADVCGTVRILPDPKHPARRKILISYGHGLTPPKGATRNLPPNTVVDDTLYPFLLAHWSALMRGHAVKFHFVSLKWERAFTFRLVRIGETATDGRTVEQIKMAPVNFFVARFVKPMIFNVAKAPPHHLLSYTGRAMPRVKKGNSWKYLDAETVFHWKQSK